MKKLLALVLATALMFCLCACSTSKDDVKGNVSKVENTSDAASAVESGAEEEISIGVNEGNVYSNEFFGIKCELDNTWTLSSEEEIAQMNGFVLDNLGDEYAEKAKNADYFYDMVASKTDSTQTLNIVIQNIGKLYGALFDAEAVAEASLESSKDALTQLGYSNVTAETAKFKFLGKEEPGVVITAEISGIKFYEAQVYVAKGGYVAIVTVGSYYEDNIQNLFDMFKSL
ncbi:MAG: hypothetical protein IJL87_04135 [Clostridia bacterium]|nr:hypothetical protein [Clostridia bacterium]